VKISGTELVWPGKYDEEGNRLEPPRVSLPFQVIETVNVSRASREAAAKPEQRTLFDYWDTKEGVTFAEGWRNKLIWGDNLLVMNSLMDRFGGKIDLIYIDPPFATGADFSFSAEIGDSGDELFKEQSVIEEKAYSDTWGGGLSSYLAMMFPRLKCIRHLLSPTGSVFVHVGWQANSHLRLLLDELFGGNALADEIIWHYQTSSGAPTSSLIKNHATILRYANGPSATFNQLREPWPEDTLKKWQKDDDGRIYRVQNKFGKRFYIDPAGRLIDDIWKETLASRSHERVNYPTQKPLALLKKAIELCSKPGDLVADFFVGSGTTLVAAETLGRRWIGCDLGRYAVHTSRKRLLDVQDCKPFEVLNLGRYERQYWQGITFGKVGHDITEQAVFQYLAFVLRLYKAEPVAGMEHLHGRRAGAMVHIGAVDAPVTIDEITRALDECVSLKQKELHVLGWEWEMGLAGPNNDVKTGGLMHQVAKQKGIKLILLQIPREVMEEQVARKGEVQFFELAYLHVAVNKPKKLTVVIGLKAFVIPNTDLIPEVVRAKVTKWSDYIDYWSVDWDFQNDTFIQGFVTYRTRKNRKLLLGSDPHTYEKPGKYRVVVKVIDIFGNDTSQGYMVEV